MGSCIHNARSHSPSLLVKPLRDRRLKAASTIKATAIPAKIFNLRRRLAVDFLVNSPHPLTKSAGFTSPGRQGESNPSSANNPPRPPRPSGRSESQPTLSNRPGRHATPVLTYRLEVVQQPQRAAEFGSSALTRLPLAPPLIVQLSVTDPAGKLQPDDEDLPFMVCHLSLFSGSGTSSESQNLYGSLVSSPQVYRDLHGRQGIYFIFPDVSIRTRGHFHIRVSLIRLPSMEPRSAEHVRDRDYVLAETRTETFQVFAREDYVAPSQTALTRYLLQQGARMYAFESSIPH